jgi:pimeloyl-ACP methyl ester carboxylesterase
MRTLRESFVLSFLRVLVALSLSLVALLSIILGRTEMSLWGWSYSLVALGLALQIAPTRLRERFGNWVEVPSLLLVLLCAVRIAFYGASERASLVTIDAHGRITGGARWIDRLFEERDASMVGSRLLIATGMVPPEFPTLPSLLIASYPAHEAFAPRLATPVLSTLLGLDNEDANNAILVRSTQQAPTLGVIFLHGYAGNFAFQCLEIAAAVAPLSAEVICPSDHFVGRWSDPAALRIIDSSIAILRARGAQRIVLVGLSNGAIGASRHADELDINALVLISGVSSRAPTPRVPTLLLQGRSDAMVSTSRVRAWARAHPRVRYVELPGTHFVLIEQRAAMRRAMRAFCAQPLRMRER